MINFIVFGKFTIKTKTKKEQQRIDSNEHVGELLSKANK